MLPPSAQVNTKSFPGNVDRVRQNAIRDSSKARGLNKPPSAGLSRRGTHPPPRGPTNRFLSEHLARRTVGLATLQCCTIGDDMLNPWLTLSMQTARLGWETQAAVVHHMFRIAGIGVSERGEAESNEHLSPLPERSEPAAYSSPTIETPVQPRERREAAHKVTIHRKRSRGPKRHSEGHGPKRRSK
jgi:hypothetical protein